MGGGGEIASGVTSRGTSASSAGVSRSRRASRERKCHDNNIDARISQNCEEIVLLNIALQKITIFGDLFQCQIVMPALGYDKRRRSRENQDRNDTLNPTSVISVGRGLVRITHIFRIMSKAIAYNRC